MHRFLLPLPLVGAIACSSEPTPSPKTVAETIPESESPETLPELEAVLSGVVGSHDRVLAHELETRASRSPDLFALTTATEVPAVDDDVARFLPECVAIEKSFDPLSQTFSFHADASDCADHSGKVSAEQVVTRDDELLRLTEVHRLTFEDDRTPLLTLSGEAERTRVVERETLSSREQAVELHVDLTVALEEGSGDGANWSMTFDHEIALKPVPTGIQVTANGTVQLDSGVRNFSMQGFWARDACGVGGWTEGTLTLDHNGQSEELALDCARTTEGLAGYAQPTIDAILRDSHACVNCDIAGLDLQHTLYVGHNLEDVQLTDVDLGGAILFGSNLSDAVLERVDLTETDFTEVDLDDASFVDCTFDYTRFVATDFSDSDLRGADLRTAVLVRIDFEDASLDGGTLAGQDLSQVSLEEAHMSGVDFTGATMTDRYCEDTNFRDANFTNADLTGSVLHEASLSGSVWSNTTCADGSNSDDNSGRTCEGYW